MKHGAVYIITNKHHTTLYTGVTSNLFVRIRQHRQKHYPKSFSAQYNLNKLVYYRYFDGIMAAIIEEKRLKAGSRQQKLDLIQSMNPGWRDLFERISPY